jgi:predicted heme/steroid binding protein
MEEYSKEEIAQFDGTEGRKAYICYHGKIYDVSESPFFVDGQHFQHKVGLDLSEELIDAPHGEEVFEEVPLVGRLREE